VAIHTRTCTESQQAFHVEAIGFNLNTMVATLSTFADRLKLFSRFQNRPQFILLQLETGRAVAASESVFEPRPRSQATSHKHGVVRVTGGRRRILTAGQAHWQPASEPRLTVPGSGSE
jgi:hypothetical protein